MQINQKEKELLVSGLNLAVEKYQNNIKALNRIQTEANKIFNDFFKLIDNERKSLESMFNSQSIHSISSSIYSAKPNSIDVDVMVATARSLIDVADSESFKNKYISDNQFVTWLNELRNILSIPLISRNENSPPLNHDEVKLLIEKPVIEKNKEISSYKKDSEIDLILKNFDQIYSNHNNR